MISKVEFNRIIRMKRQANYYRSRAENGELTKKQITNAMANANAMSWLIQMAISGIEHREKERIHDRFYDRIIKLFRKRKYWKNKQRYDDVEQMIRDLYTADIMDHEKTYDGLQKIIEKKDYSNFFDFHYF